MIETISLFIFLSAGILAELFYALVYKKESKPFEIFARVVIYSIIALLARLCITIASGNPDAEIAVLFSTAQNCLEYLGISLILGLFMPNIYFALSIAIESLAHFLAQSSSNKKENVNETNN